ncbi:PREDICTED: ribonuclease, liver-like [Nanorana parkeri]|uniref:ribonuclease, liver-like n=1 Tax=Nanorana parkeri TaxID=125878 RepID=UPI000854F58D|nr:PREDICTED: ribonuclease, liver-like [Nanorana parkeri]
MLRLLNPQIPPTRMSRATICFLMLGMLISLIHLSNCQDWQSFKTKHVVSSRNINCKEKLKYPLFLLHGKCRAKNTFIVESEKTVLSICRKAIKKRTITSPMKVRLAICQERKNTQCAYDIEVPKNSQICLLCYKGKPIHFVKQGKCL